MSRARGYSDIPSSPAFRTVIGANWGSEASRALGAARFGMDGTVTNGIEHQPANDISSASLAAF